MNGVLVEIDLIAEYLAAASGERTLLRELLMTLPCYTTFLQAAEIYSVTRTDEERRIVDRALFGLKILGASSRYAKTIGNVLSSLPTVGDHRTAIVAAMAIESKLPVVTDLQSDRLGSIPGIRVLPARTLRQHAERGSLREHLEQSS